MVDDPWLVVADAAALSDAIVELAAPVVELAAAVKLW